MNDLVKAKAVLEAEELTCVLCKGDVLIKRSEKGISPMLDLISEGADLKGFSAADKIIGKAAAMLFSYSGVTEVYGQVMSRAAAEFLDTKGIAYSYGTMTETIINRKGDGICPMEQTVTDINDTEKAYRALLAKRDELRKKTNGE